jgi:hypothetical protein
MLSRRPRLSIRKIREIMQETCEPMTASDFSTLSAVPDDDQKRRLVGAGRIHASAALQRALEET